MSVAGVVPPCPGHTLRKHDIEYLSRFCRACGLSAKDIVDDPRAGCRGYPTASCMRVPVTAQNEAWRLTPGMREFVVGDIGNNGHLHPAVGEPCRVCGSLWHHSSTTNCDEAQAFLGRNVVAVGTVDRSDGAPDTRGCGRCGGRYGAHSVACDALVADTRSQAVKAAEVLQRWVLMGRQCVQCQAPNDNPDKGANFCLACVPKPRRFDTQGRKWLAPVECSLQWERVHGERMPILTGTAESSAAAYVHPRSLKGRVNVAALAVDDPNGDDVS